MRKYNLLKLLEKRACKSDKRILYLNNSLNGKVTFLLFSKQKEGLKGKYKLTQVTYKKIYSKSQLNLGKDSA